MGRIIAELRLIRRIGRDLLVYSITRQSRIDIQHLPQLRSPGRMYGIHSLDVPIHLYLHTRLLMVRGHGAQAVLQDVS
jgi:hypothetical protein